MLQLVNFKYASNICYLASQALIMLLIYLNRDKCREWGTSSGLRKISLHNEHQGSRHITWHMGKMVIGITLTKTVTLLLRLQEQRRFDRWFYSVNMPQWISPCLHTKNKSIHLTYWSALSAWTCSDNGHERLFLDVKLFVFKKIQLLQWFLLSHKNDWPINISQSYYWYKFLIASVNSEQETYSISRLFLECNLCWGIR